MELSSVTKTSVSVGGHAPTHSVVDSRNLLLLVKLKSCFILSCLY